MTLFDKKLFVFDMDGTIYLGGKPFDFAVDFIRYLRGIGKKVLFFTNNSSHTHDFYLEKLGRLGFGAVEEEICTSADVALDFLLRFRPGKKVFLLANDGVRAEMAQKGMVLGTAEDSDIVLSAFDTELTYEKLSAACRLIAGGAEFLSTHPDFNCPTEDGFIPDCGAINAFIKASVGKAPKYFGKPYEETKNMICRCSGIMPAEMCVLGDRLYTDIALGKRHGILSVLVLTGETTEEMLAAAAPEERPDLVFPSLREVHLALLGEADGENSSNI